MNTKRTIGITTFWDTPVNYGQVLQGFALITKLKEWNFDPFIIRYTMTEESSTESNSSKIYRFLSGRISFKRYIKRFYHKTERDINRGFDDFKKKYMTYSENQYPSLKSLITNYPQADIYITGSDQVWGEWGSENKKRIFLLDFLPDTIKRISYAASFGRNSLNDSELKLFRNALSKFDAISVREKSGIDICNRLNIKKTTEWVADPTLLLNRDSWIKCLDLKYSPQKERTAFIYLMQNEYTTKLEHKIIKYLKKKGYIIRYVSSAYYIDPKSNYNPTIQEWLINILSSDIVITSSFHGTLFAANFNTPIISLCGREGVSGQNSRIYSLLEEVGLSDRIMDTFDKDKLNKLLSNKIDWSIANKVFNKKRFSSELFLQNALKL